jgi:hypothetical protein
VKRPGRPKSKAAKTAQQIRTAYREKLLEKIRTKAGRDRLVEIDDISTLVRENEYDKWVWQAARILYTLESGSDYQKTRCSSRLDELRQTKFGKQLDPSGRISGRFFLHRFIEEFSPLSNFSPDGKSPWNWRLSIDRGEHSRAECGRVQFLADQIEESRARQLRHATAQPNPADLRRLGLAKLPDTSTWPTLRELKIGTAIPERTIKKIIAKLQPKKGEVVTPLRRHRFSRRGAMPKRFGPHLVVAVLDEFVKRLPDCRMEGAERERFRKIAMTVKRAIMSKLSRSRSIT